MEEADLNLIVKRAGHAARSLGHDWIGPEHLLLALLSVPDAAGVSLRACGLRPVDVEEYLRALPAHYQRKRLPPGFAAGTLFEEHSTHVVLAFAQGLAVGDGGNQARPEHVLLALLWKGNEDSRDALRALERSGATGAQVLSELRERGDNVPSVPLPNRRIWQPAYPVAASDFERVTRELRRAGRN